MNDNFRKSIIKKYGNLAEFYKYRGQKIKDKHNLQASIKGGKIGGSAKVSKGYSNKKLASLSGKIGGKASARTVIVCKVCKEEVVKGSLLGHIRSKHPSKPRKLSSIKLDYVKERIPKAKPGDSLFK
jgi:hypothetical protein